MTGVGKYRRGSEKRRRGKKTGGLNFSNSPSSFFSAKEHFSCCRTNFSSPYMLAIASVLFSNYYASVYNVYYLQLINGGMRGDISTFFSLIFQVTFSRPGNIFIVVPTSSFFMCLNLTLNSFERNVILFQVTRAGKVRVWAVTQDRD